MFVHLSDETNILLLWYNSVISFRNCPRKLFLVNLNCMFLITNISSDTKLANSSTLGGHLLDRKPKVNFFDCSSFLRNRNGVHLILLIMFSTFIILNVILLSFLTFDI